MKLAEETRKVIPYSVILTNGFPVGGPNESLYFGKRVSRASETEPEYAAPVRVSLHRVLVLPEEVRSRTIRKPIT